MGKIIHTGCYLKERGNKLMSIYLSIDQRKEIKERISNIEQIKENLIDAKAEYEEIIQMNPNVKTRGTDDQKNSGGYKIKEQNDKIINMSMRKDALKKRIDEYNIIIKDFDRGWNILSEKEKEILELRYKQNMKQETVARNLKMDRKTIYNIEMNALRKMELELLKL